MPAKPPPNNRPLRYSSTIRANIEPSDHAWLKAEADRQRVSIATIIRKCVTEYREASEAQRRPRRRN